MKLIIGLGNPEPKYFETRHNAGFLVVDQLQKTKLSKDVVLRKSDTFMNDSGSFVKKLINRYSLSTNDLYIIHDDLDIALGEYKIQFGKGPKDHNGVKSIDGALGTGQYWHVRIGIENRKASSEATGKDYVLENFSDEERKILDKTINLACKKLATSLKNTN